MLDLFARYALFLTAVFGGTLGFVAIVALIMMAWDRFGGAKTFAVLLPLVIVAMAALMAYFGPIDAVPPPLTRSSQDAN